MEEMLSDVLASYLFMAIMLTIIVISYYRMGGGRFDHGTEEENSSA